MWLIYVDIAGEVHVPADGHQLPEFQATGHTAAGVAHTESHEDHGYRDRGFGYAGGRLWDVIWFTQGFQETRAVPGFRNAQPQVHRSVACELETRTVATIRTDENHDDSRLYDLRRNSSADELRCMRE